MPQIVNVRELRKALAFHMNGDHAVVIGSRWQYRAILIPLTNMPHWDCAKRRKAIAHAAKESLATLGALRKALRP